MNGGYSCSVVNFDHVWLVCHGFGALFKTFLGRIKKKIAVPTHGEGARPTGGRSERIVREQANKRSYVAPPVRATKPERIAILFGAAVALSRGRSRLVPGHGSSNGRHP